MNTPLTSMSSRPKIFQSSKAFNCVALALGRLIKGVLSFRTPLLSAGICITVCLGI